MITNFLIDATGDVVVGDHIEFEKDIWSGSYWKPSHMGTELIQAKVIKDSYGDKKQQHTFTVVYDDTGEIKRIKGRNLYRYKVMREKWDDEESRKIALNEKHKRGNKARLKRELYKQTKEEKVIYDIY